MKKVKFLSFILICILSLSVGCNNSSTGSDTATKDSTLPSDTIKSDPSKFSDPH